MSATEMAPPPATDPEKPSLKDRKTPGNQASGESSAAIATDINSNTTPTSSKNNGTTATTSSDTATITTTSSDTTTTTTNDDSCEKESGIETLADPVQQAGGRKVVRGRRILTCKICRYTSNNTQEFTNHQNTAHTEGRDKEDASQEPPARRSSRARRATVTFGTDTEASDTSGTKNVAKKGDSSGAKKNPPNASNKKGVARKSSTSSAGGEETVSKQTTPCSARNTSTPTQQSFSTKNCRTVIAALKKYPTDSAHHPQYCEAAEALSSESVPTAEGSENLVSVSVLTPSQSGTTDSPTSTSTSALSQSGTTDSTPLQSGTTESLKSANASASSQPGASSTVTLLSGTASMISTNGPTIPQDCNMSGASEDEHDLSEEGGRLVIDDSNTANSSSIVMPTRCGNIQNRTYMCEECNFTTTSAQQSLRHKKNEHGHDFTIYECNLCDYATKYKQKLPRHYKLHFSGSDLSVEPMQGSDSSVTSPQGAPSFAVATPNQPALAPVTPTTPSNPSSPGRKRSASEAFGPNLTALPAEVILEEGEEDDCDDNDTVGSSTPPPDGAESENLLTAATVTPPAKKKRKDVSPDKYFEVAEEVASTKFGCAKCGNVYKWKKSLNKHWKEKHGSDPGDQLYTPPGMHILLQQGNHTQTEHRRCCHKNLLERITVKQRGADSNASSRAQTPQNFLNGHYNNGQQDDEMDGAAPLSYMPSTIPMGPFVLGTSSQPVFPSSGQRQSLINSLNAPIPSSTALDLSTHSMDEPDSVDDTPKPLDFSVQRGSQQTNSGSAPTSRSLFNSHQEATTEEDDEVSALNQLVASGENLRDKVILKCPKCSEVLKTQTAYSNHMAMHLQSSNKRVAKCGVCQMHFPNNEALNTHFMDNHLDLIASHKEAIQKIPHGLQQTYHLLKMPLHSISKLSSQETEDPLKCNMCDFTAKWPAELQKHAVSHSDERPFICMVCGSTYKWKWDLVKHFEKAHSNLPNPYKRRDPGSASGSQSAHSELQANIAASNSQDSYEMEEGEIATAESKIRSLNGEIRSLSGRVDSSGSFLFDQGSGSSQDDISVENILRTSQQASLMMSRQPNFLDGPDEPQPSSSSASSPHPESGGEGMQILDVRSLQGMCLPTNSSVTLPSADPQAVEGGGSESRPIRQVLARNIRGRQSGSSLPFSSQASRPKGVSKTAKGAYKGYKTVEGSEASDLKYQCVLCDYKARWPSEIMQHMKNHSSEKPYGCPNCTYRSKWKWDVVKHLKRCGGGTIKDVIDYSQKSTAREAPPNVMVTPEGSVVQSQQAVSPVPSTSHAIEEPAGSMQALAGVSSDGQVPFLQAPYLISVPSSGTSATSSLNALALTQLMSRFKAAREAEASQSLTTSAEPPAQSPSPSSASSSQPEQGAQQPPVVFNSLINEGQHHCLHCTFVANSPAELRRHQALHSEEKPYICDECSYSTKWKCDMKKHKEKYKHNGPIKVIRPNGDLHDADKNTVEKCPVCPFETYSKEALQSHVRQNHPDQASGKKSPSGRFKCKKCQFSTNELVDLINHRRVEHPPKDSDETRQSPTLNGANELDEARLKHPRKAMKKYSCNKCSFVCLKSTELLEHHQRAHRYHYCPFCTKRFLNKSSLLDHLIIHPEFDSKEWELLYFDDTSDAEEDVNNNTNNPIAVDDSSKITVGSTANTIDLTANNNSPPPLIPANASEASDQNLPCQWCDARFANIVRLYQHSSNAHPNQMKEQEMAEGLHKTSTSSADTPQLARSRAVAVFGSSNGDSRSKGQSKKDKLGQTLAKVNGKLVGISPRPGVSSGMSLLHAPTLVAQLGHSQLLQSPQAVAVASGSNHEMGLNLSTKRSLTRPTAATAALFPCTKCSFKTLNVDDYLIHMAKHSAGEKQWTQSQIRAQSLVSSGQTPKGLQVHEDELRCWFCGELHKSFLDVYRHMLEVHPTDLNERTEQREVLMQKIAQEIKPKSQNSSKSEHPKSQSGGSASRREHLMLTGGEKNWLRKKKVLAYKGTPLHRLQLNSKEMWYKCVLCNVMDRNPAQVSKHTLQVHHDLPRKFQCGHCGQSDEKVQGILHHQQTMHPDMLPDVTVLDYEEITLPIHVQQRTYSCKLCPYKSESKEEVEKHYSLHYSQASFVCDHCPFTTKVKEEIASHVHSHNASTATDPSSKGFSLVLDTSSPVKTSPNKYPLQTPPIKQEPMSFSPPHASTPVQDPSQPAPLDLSTEPADDRKDINSKAISLPVQKPDQCKERMDLDEDDADDVGAASEKAAQLTTACSQEKAADDEAREIMEAEAANDTDKVSMEVAAVGEKQVRVYKCKHCPYSSSSNFDFRSHCSFHGLKGRFECDYCTYSHGELANITQHRQLHSHQPGYNPDYKPQPSPEESTLKGEDGPTPTASPRSTSTPAPEMLECPDCPYRTSLRKSYNIHVGMHGQRQHYICDFCDWSADRLVILVQHRIIHDKEPDFDASPKDSVFINPEYPKPKDVPGEFEAKLLDSRSSEEAAQSAASSDTQSPPFKLSITKKLYTCPQCPYVTGNRTAYDYHLGLHGAPGCFACEQCSYHTDRWGLYCQHSRLHEEQKAPSPAPQPSKTDKADGGDRSSPAATTAATPGVLPSEKSYDGDAAAADSSKSDSSPAQEATGRCSSASDYGSLTSGDTKSDDASDSEHRCQRCPFSTTCKQKLIQHAKHHSGADEVVCRYCDYACASKEKLLVHIQLHFPSAPIDMDALTQMLSTPKKGSNSAVLKEAITSAAAKVSEKGEGANDGGCEDSAVKVSQPASEKKTRVYACRFCDREFEEKNLMIQHERQHQA